MTDLDDKNASLKSQLTTFRGEKYAELLTLEKLRDQSTIDKRSQFSDSMDSVGREIQAINKIIYGLL